MKDQMIKGYVCALGAVAIWSGFILVSRQGGISPLLAYDVIAIRYLTCALIVLPVWLFWKRFNLFQSRFILSSLVGGLAYALFAFHGFEASPASHAAVLLPGLLPMVITLLAVALNNERRPISTWFGVLVITLGISLLFIDQFKLAGELSIGHLSLMGAAMCWGLFSVLINRWNIKPWEATISLALLTCMVYVPFYLLFLPRNISLEYISDIGLQALYQGVLATIVQMLLYVRAVQIIGASAMGSMMAIVPVLAGFTAIPLFNESLSASLSLALLLVSIGVWLANANTIRKRQPHSSAGERHALYQYQNHR